MYRESAFGERQRVESERFGFLKEAEATRTERDRGLCCRESALGAKRKEKEKEL